MPCPCILRPCPGPRRRNEGVDDEDQGIVAAESTPTGATVTVSLLAAGFVVGPGGASVRAICAATSADVRSYTESQSGRRVRVFVLEVGAGRCDGWLVFRRADTRVVGGGWEGWGRGAGGADKVCVNVRFEFRVSAWLLMRPCSARHRRASPSTWRTPCRSLLPPWRSTAP